MGNPPSKQSAVMRHFSTLAGQLQPAVTFRGSVTFKDMLDYDQLIYRSWTRILAYGTLLLVLSFAFVLFRPANWVVHQEPLATTHFLNWLMLICLGLLEIFLIVGTFAATRATVKAKNPVPLQPPKGLRVAFVTTRAPGEPVSMVRTTLAAAKNVRYTRGTVDVWLLDETDDPELKAMCVELGVRHFSRKGVAEWNTGKPESMTKRLTNKVLHKVSFGKVALLPETEAPNQVFAAKSKHGNFNSWGVYLSQNDLSYDIICGVDTDHVPEPNYLERMLGYFRDPDVAFVVGPQVYGNYRAGLKGLVVRWAESQASFFQSTIQRAGNDTQSPMFVGTNYAVRTSVLDQIGGFQPCITEDMATGLAIHAKSNPDTGNHWKSVYTPDVLAVGEGPEFWGPYFSQQWRWAAGSFDTWKRMVWRVFFKLAPGERIHYFLMLTFYPMTALTWLLGVVSSMTYLLTGATAILAPWNQFMALYLMSLVMQMSLYFWNRRGNVSPHEPIGTYGMPGMMITTLTAPIYLDAFVGILMGKKPHFVVTTKGGSENPDNMHTFHIHLKWAALLFAGILFGLTHKHHHPAMLLWIMMQFVVCLAPVVLGMTAVLQERLKKQAQPEQLNVIGEQNAY